MIRDFRDSDAEAVLLLNQDNESELGPMNADQLELLAGISPFLKVVEIEDRPAGVLIGLTEDEGAYPSPNYRWFADRHSRFAYVDRIALAESLRGNGWGPGLYQEFEDWAKAANKPVLCAEVNTVPENPRSLRFHGLAGFTEVARTRPHGPDYEVAMLEKQLG